MLALGLSLPWLLRLPYLREDGWGQLIFAVILISAGLLSGVVFAAQGELCQQHGAALSLTAGRLYAVDLLGATLGTLGVSFLVIPCFGPAQTLFLCAALNASAVFLLVGDTVAPCPDVRLFNFISEIIGYFHPLAKFGQGRRDQTPDKDMAFAGNQVGIVGISGMIRDQGGGRSGLVGRC